MQNSSELDAPHSTRSLLIGIWTHLTRRRRAQFALLLLVMLASGIAELASLGAVLPFLSVLNDPELLWHNSFVKEIASRAGYSEANQLLLPTTFAFGTITLLAAFVRLMNLWINGRLAAVAGSDLSCEAYRRTLYQSYESHVQRNSAVVITAATAHINQTVYALNMLLQLITSAVVAVCLLIGLLIIDAGVAIASVTIFGASYAILALASQRILRSNGKKIAATSILQLKALQEGLGAIRDVILDGSQKTYLDIYKQVDSPQRQLMAQNSFISVFPRYAIEALGLLFISIMGCFLVLQQGNGSAAIPLLGALALGFQRLLPSLQQMYSSWASLKSYNEAIAAVLGMLNQNLPHITTVVDPLPFCKGISLEDVHFSYGPSKSPVLCGVNFNIRSGERIGIVGSTGSGKSTTLDLLMGLLKPTAGRVLIDGMELHDPAFPELLTSWWASIAHVPQTIYLSDSSIAENIAFGIPCSKIDHARVKQAAVDSQIASFIEDMPDGYQSFVGERGVRLSGGQRQRIGIARALYKKARILFLDEATSALDSATEKDVMDSVDALSRELTIVMIAHRTSTLSKCDRIIELRSGMVVY